MTGGPAPGGRLHEGATNTPRQAATVILLRGGSRELELLLVKRNPRSRFMGGFWVFPGGAVDAVDSGDAGDEDDEAHRSAAVRELEEEAGVAGLTPAELVKYSRWITPAALAVRFDTHFFLAAAPDGIEPRCDGRECVDLRWTTPSAALEAFRAGDLALVFPTIKHLEQLAEYPSAHALLEHARGRPVDPVEPRLVLSGEVARVLLPGEPGYEDV